MGNGPTRYENISVEEKKLIRESWLLMRNKMSKIGLTVFRIFFEDFSQHKKYFSIAIDNEDVLERHGLKFMRDISQIVNNMESIENVLYVLRINALSHRKMHIEVPAYDDLREAFIKMMNQELNQNIDIDRHIKAWDKGLKIMFQIITDINYDGPTSGITRVSKISNKTPINHELNDVSNAR